MCGSMVDIQSATAGIRRRKKEEREKKKEETSNHMAKYNVHNKLKRSIWTHRWIEQRENTEHITFTASLQSEK